MKTQKLSIRQNNLPDNVKENTFSGLALPFGSESRNGYVYDPESVTEAADTLVGKPVLWNHDDSIPSLGTVKSVSVEEDGLHYELELDGEDSFAQSIASKLSNGFISHVSIQALVNEDGINDGLVPITEFLELTICNIPGFGETTVVSDEVFFEKLQRKNKNQDNDVESDIMDENKENKTSQDEDGSLFEELKKEITTLREELEAVKSEKEVEEVVEEEKDKEKEVVGSETAQLVDSVLSEELQGLKERVMERITQAEADKDEEDEEEVEEDSVSESVENTNTNTTKTLSLREQIKKSMKNK